MTGSALNRPLPLQSINGDQLPIGPSASLSVIITKVSKLLSFDVSVHLMLIYWNISEGIEGNGDVMVNFPEQNRWTGLLAEMERLEVTDPETTGANTPSPLLGPFDSATVAATLQG